MKKILFISIIVVLSVCVISEAYAETDFENVSVSVNENITEEGLLINDITYVPVRNFIEDLDGVVEWRKDTESINIGIGGSIVEMTVNDDTYYINGEAHIGNAVPIIIDGKTMVPLRLLCGLLKWDIKWISDDLPVLVSAQLQTSTNNYLPNTINDKEYFDSIKECLNDGYKELAIDFFRQNYSEFMNIVKVFERNDNITYISLEDDNIKIEYKPITDDSIDDSDKSTVDRFCDMFERISVSGNHKESARIDFMLYSKVVYINKFSGVRDRIIIYTDLSESEFKNTDKRYPLERLTKICEGWYYYEAVHLYT